MLATIEAGGGSGVAGETGKEEVGVVIVTAVIEGEGEGAGEAAEEGARGAVGGGGENAPAVGG